MREGATQVRLGKVLKIVCPWMGLADVSPRILKHKAWEGKVFFEEVDKDTFVRCSPCASSDASLSIFARSTGTSTTESLGCSLSDIVGPKAVLTSGLLPTLYITASSNSKPPNFELARKSCKLPLFITTLLQRPMCAPSAAYAVYWKGQ